MFTNDEQDQPRTAALEQAISILAEQHFGELAQVPAEQRVRELLSEAYGPVWASASVFAYSAPSGHLLYAAFGPAGLDGALAMQVVGEKSDGTLAIAAPLPGEVDEIEDAPEEEEPDMIPLFAPDRARTYRNECRCVQQIIPALIEAREIVGQSERIGTKRKKRIRSQLAHACRHLKMHLDNMRPE